MRQIQTAAFGMPEYEPKRVGGYRPKIAADQLGRLWLLKQKTGKPITKLVREAIDIYLACKKGGDSYDLEQDDPGRESQMAFSANKRHPASPSIT